jgi:hypothetical protein
VATKTIVRWKPPNELYARRELLPASLEAMGIFTQTTPLYWDREHGFWLDAEAAGISPDLLDRLESDEFNGGDLGQFTIETQDVPDKDEAPAEEPKQKPRPSTRAAAGESAVGTKEGE